MGSNVNVRIALSGIYFFGGINAKGDEVNTLHILKPGQKPVKWIVPTT